MNAASPAIECGFDGPTNMARDAALLDSVVESDWAVRVYQWSDPWVTLGKFQDASRDLLPTCPIPFAMRPTGGRAVLHGHDLTIGLALHLRALAGPSEPVETLSRNVRRAYRAAVAPIIDAMQACGIDACLGETLKGAGLSPRSADCFAHISANDVIDKRTMKKTCGIAMALTAEATLVQASLPIGPPRVDPALVYASPSPPSWVELDPAKFAEALLDALSQRFEA